MKKIITLILLVLLIVGAVFLLMKRKADLAHAVPPSVLPAVVATKDLKTAPVRLTLPAMGTVASDVSVVLSTKVSGRVTGLYTREGDSVRKGEVLARIDVKDLEAKKHGLALQRQGIAFQIDGKKAEVKALETSLKSARDVHVRTQELLAVKGASIEQSSQEEAHIAGIMANLTTVRNSIETLKKSMETLDASMRGIDSLMGYATLVSPIDGTVSQIMVRPGGLATPGKPLLGIASKTGLYLRLSLPDNIQAANILFKGRESALTSRHQAGETGLVQYVAPLPADENLVEGQYLNVHVVIYKAEGVLVPFDALLTMDGSSSVFVLPGDGKAERQIVHIKARGVEGVAVTENLAGRTVIVAKPDILLRVSTGVPVVLRNK